MGRQAQLDWLRSRVRADGSAVIVGDPGVGKTRLMAEVLELEGQRRPVARVAVASSSVSLPLGPLAHLLPTTFDAALDVNELQDVLRTFREQGAEDGTRLLVGVDDAHWLDDLSAVVLHHAVTAGAIQVIATARADTPLPDAIAQIARGEHGTRLDLLPLDPDAIAALISIVLGGPADGATIARVDEATAGNPLAVIELLTHGQSSGRLTQRAGLWTWTGAMGSNLRLKQLLGLSLDDLGDDERELLELVALGEPLPIPVVESVAAPEVVASLERHGHIVATVRDGTVRPGHPLTAEQAIEDLGVLRRRQLLSRLVDAFSAAGIDTAATPDDRIRVALWSLDCGRPVSVDELRTTAELARHRQADVESERLAREAFEAEPDFATGLLLARTLHGLGRYDEANAILVGLEPMMANDRERVDYAAVRALTLRYGLDRVDEARALIDRVRAGVEDESLRWELVAMQARDDSMQGQLTRVVALWDEAVEAGAPEPVRYDIAEWACNAFALMGQNDRSAELLAWVGEASARCGEHNPRVAMLAQFGWVLGLAASGETATAAALATPVYDGAVRDGNEVLRAYTAMILVYVALHSGDLVTAERLAREATLVPPTSKSVRMGALCALARILALQGRAADAARVLDDLAEEEERSLLHHHRLRDAARALLTFADGRELDAVVALEASATASAADGQSLAAVQTLFDLTRLGYPSRALRVLTRLADTQGAFADTTGAYTRAAADKDVDALVEVAHRARDAQLRLVAVAALTDAATVDRAAGRPSAAAKHDHARDEIASECVGLPAPAVSTDLGLTAREREVARLAARHLTDKAIAEELYVSVRTVNAHLRSVYRKLGVSSRSELEGVPGL